MKVKKIRCLLCRTVIENDWEKEVVRSGVSCNCKNETTLINFFTLSQPQSVVTAIDKTKVQAQLLEYDKKLGNTGDWFYLIEPETKETPKYRKWLCKLEDGGIIGGLIVEWESPKLMTFNECRMYIKNNNVQHKDGRIFHLIKNKG